MRLYSRAQFAVRHAASKDETRISLNGVYFDAEGRTVATDGFMLARFTAIDPPAAEEFPSLGEDGPKPNGKTAQAPFILPLSECERIARAIPTDRSLPILAHAVLDTERSDAASKDAHFSMTDMEHVGRYSARKIESEFPNYEKAMSSDLPHVVTLDAAFLERAIKVVKEAASKNAKLALKFHMHPTDSCVPVRITFTDPNTGELELVIMPIRL